MMNMLAADIGGTSTKMAICDEQGTLSHYKEYETESSKGGPHVIRRLMDQIASMEAKFEAIAISTAGQVDVEQGSILYANENIPSYTGMQVRKIVEERFGKPVMVENDVNAAALGEARFGAGQSSPNFICLTYGTGVGGAIVIDHNIYRGSKGSAGEFGHMITHSSMGGRLSYYETFASTSALVREARKLDLDCTDGRTLFRMIDEGNTKLLSVLNSWIDEVAAGLATLVHIFNPSAIVVGGGVMERGELIPLIEAKTKGLVMASFRDFELRKAHLGNKAGLLGAASLFLGR